MNKLKELRSAAMENPVLLLFLGAGPAMGASAGLKSALALGLCLLAVVFLSALIISALRRFLSEAGILWASVLCAAGFVSLFQLLLEAWAPGVYPSLALYLAACSVNLMVFSDAEAGAAKSLKAGLLFLAAILLTGFIRELFGSASLWGSSLAALEEYKLPLLNKAPGGFLVFALVLAGFQALLSGRKKEEK